MADAAPKAGQGVDSNGESIVDPTLNVRELVAEGLKRQDDLRESKGETWQAKFDGLRNEFIASEKQRVEQKSDTQKAVDAALAAAKEAVNAQAAASEKAIAKSETTSTEQVKQQTATFTAALAGNSVLLSDLKDRITAIENIKLGSESLRTDQRQSIGTIIGVAGGLFGLVMVVIAVVTFISTIGKGT